MRAMRRVGRMRVVNGVVKSVQRGTITLSGATTATATIAAVDPNNSRLKWVGESSTEVVDDNLNKLCASVELTDATTVTARRNSATGSYTVVVSYEVIEYWPGVVRVQRGTINPTTSGATATIASVNPDHADVELLGWNGGTTDARFGYWYGRIALTNATTVTATMGVVAVLSVGYQVTEWL